MGDVYVVLPNDIDDPASPSGGNRYDRRVCAGLAASGWSVHECAVPGAWPRPSPRERAGLARVLAAVPDDAVVLVDGLVASPVPDVLVPESGRLRLVVLVHMPLGDSPEAAVLGAARAVIATSAWSRRRLLDLHSVRAHDAPPGVDAAPLASGSAAGTELLCVAAVTQLKGYDVLVDALASVAELPWTCTCIGPLSRDVDFVERLRGRIEASGLAGRVRLAGPRTGAALDAAFAAADLLVLASRGETYGMVVAEALARGTPVLATAVGGVAEALGHAPDGSRPGMLVTPGDAGELSAALRRWLTDPEWRDALRRSARGRRGTVPGWDAASDTISKILNLAANM